MKIALFDLDHTVLDGDTNILWIDYLIEQGIASPDTAARQQHFMELYAREELDMNQYMDFHIGVFKTKRISEWLPIIEAFIQSQVVPRLAPDALAMLESHRVAGDKVTLVTATNSVLVDVLAKFLDVQAISTVVDIVDDRPTGRVLGLPAFREHKIARVEEWLGFSVNSEQVEASHFYSDSSNDIPLLKAVSHPVAVNPDAKLSALAKEKAWLQLRWKLPSP
jgi:HAD superfamily hydrolase (TIGR01490 family)